MPAFATVIRAGWARSFATVCSGRQGARHDNYVQPIPCTAINTTAVTARDISKSSLANGAQVGRLLSHNPQLRRSTVAVAKQKQNDMTNKQEMTG